MLNVRFASFFVGFYVCAPQLQTGLETNRILLQSVSPRLSSRQSKEKKSNSKVKNFTGVVQGFYFSLRMFLVWKNVTRQLKLSVSLQC